MGEIAPPILYDFFFQILTSSSGSIVKLWDVESGSDRLCTNK